MKNKWLTACLIGSALFIMLLFPEPTLKGTRSGLLLWYHHFLPAIFPFMILSGILTRYLEKGGPVFAVAAGFMNGYPNGAKTAADLTKRGLLPKETACYYAAFCNLSGPMFLAAYADLKQEMPIIYLVSILLLWLFCRFHSQKTSAASPFHTFSDNFQISEAEANPPEQTEDYLLECTGIMVKAGIYIMYFSILIELLSQPAFSNDIVKLMIPFLELTTGIACIQSTTFPLPALRRYFRLFLCVFGGLSTAFQTREVTYGLDLSLPRYLALKFIQASAVCLVCFLLSMLKSIF